MESQITPFYSRTNILITGGTGFLGKLLVQKLLRTCPDIEGIYLIVRAKKDKSSSQRMDEIFKDVIFDVLKKEQPKFLTAMHMIEGDCSHLNLGISESNKNFLINKINVVFHCAGLVNFTADLKTAAHTNIRALKHILDLCHEMPKLKSIVFVSTAYSNCQNSTIEERFYDPPIEGSTLLNFVEECNENVIAKAEEGFLQNAANTYCITKCVAENVLLNDGKNLPACLFRPSIVLGTYADPVPGWTSNVYGPMALGIGIAAGLVRVTRSRPDVKVDFVPADFVVNSLICAARETHEKWKSSAKLEDFSIPVYNYSGNYEKNITLKTLNDIHSKSVLTYPMSNPLWMDMVIFMPNEFLYQILKFLLHTIPALFLDCFLLLAGKKLKFKKIYKKIDVGVDIYRYFGCREWNILNTNVKHLWQHLNDTDQKLFPFNIDTLNYKEYLKLCWVGLKVYILKESLDNLKAEQKYYRKLQKIHYATVTILTTLLLLFCYKMANIFLFKISS